MCDAINVFAKRIKFGNTRDEDTISHPANLIWRCWVCVPHEMFERSFFVFPSNVDRESPISGFFVMSAVFVSFFDSVHFLFWNGRVVWHIVPGTHSFVQHVASVCMSDVRWQSAWEDARSDNLLDGLFLPEFWWFMCVLWVIGEWTWCHQCYLFTRDVGHAETWCLGHHQFRCGACMHWTLCEACIFFVCTKLRNHCSISGQFLDGLWLSFSWCAEVKVRQFRCGCCR